MGHIEIEKIKGTENPADLLTKYKDLESIRLYAGWTNCGFETGRHELMPQVSEKEGSADDPWEGPVNKDVEE